MNLYDLDGIDHMPSTAREVGQLFEKKEEVKDNDYNDLLRLCEEVFNRALNVTEMTILNDLMREYPKEKINVITSIRFLIKIRMNYHVCQMKI